MMVAPPHTFCLRPTTYHLPPFHLTPFPHKRMILSSPSRRVTRSRSRYSSRGMAYLRESPVNSLKSVTPSGCSVPCGVPGFPAISQSGTMEDQVFGDLVQESSFTSIRAISLRAPGPGASLPALRVQWHSQASLFKRGGNLLARGGSSAESRMVPPLKRTISPCTSTCLAGLGFAGAR